MEATYIYTGSRCLSLYRVYSPDKTRLIWFQSACRSTMRFHDRLSTLGFRLSFHEYEIRLQKARQRIEQRWRNTCTIKTCQEINSSGTMKRIPRCAILCQRVIVSTRLPWTWRSDVFVSCFYTYVLRMAEELCVREFLQLKISAKFQKYTRTKGSLKLAR